MAHHRRLNFGARDPSFLYAGDVPADPFQESRKTSSRHLCHHSGLPQRPEEDLEIRLPGRVLLSTCVAPQWLATPSSRGNRSPFMRGTSPHPFILHPGTMGGGCATPSEFCLCRRGDQLPSGAQRGKTATPPTKVLLQRRLCGTLYPGLAPDPKATKWPRGPALGSQRLVSCRMDDAAVSNSPRSPRPDPSGYWPSSGASDNPAKVSKLYVSSTL